MVSKATTTAVSPTRKKLGRKGTMDQTIADGLNFVHTGTYDEEAKKSVISRGLGKRKVIPVYRDEADEEPPKKKRKTARSLSPAKPTTRKSPPRAAAAPKPTVAKTKKAPKTRSVSPKTTSSRGIRAANRNVNTTNSSTPSSTTSTFTQPPRRTAHTVNSIGAKEAPILWEFKSNKPAFGVHISNGRCYMSNDNGDIYGFTLDGEMQTHIKLPNGIKSVVSDMSYWLYAGCDNGVVYDLSQEDEPRVAYHFKETTFDQSAPTQPLIDPMIDSNNTTAVDITDIEPLKSRHIVFAIDVSFSMGGARIKAVADNLRMMLQHHIRDDDLLSVITFDSTVKIGLQRKQKATDLTEINNFINTKLNVDGCTAFYDALKTSWQEFSDNPDEEKWIIALTDGEDNQSKHSSNDILQLAKTNHQVNLVTILLDDLRSQYTHKIAEICSQTKEGLLIKVDSSKEVATEYTSAFKQVAQLLSSKIMWMDIRDGLLSVSDNKGRLCACSIEGTPIWQQQSAGNCGWMVRTDFEGVYHGHSMGVTKYAPGDGHQIWHKNLPDRVLFGWLDKTKKKIYVGAGNSVYQIDCEQDQANTAEIGKHSCVCDATVSATAATYGSESIYAADVLGFIYGFSETGERKWKLSTGGRGAAMSMHFHEDKLYAVTSSGSLLCIDVESTRMNEFINAGKSATCKQIGAPANMKTTLPSNSVIGQTNTVGDGILVEVYQEFSDAQLLDIHRALHDTSVDLVTVNGREYGIELHTNKCRSVKIDGVLYIQQNPEKGGKYGDMARNGSKITWVCNSGRWGLVIDDVVHINGTRLLVKVLPNDKGFDVSKPVQFPTNYRTKGATYVVDGLVPSENDEFYRVKGSIKLFVQ